MNNLLSTIIKDINGNIYWCDKGKRSFRKDILLEESNLIQYKESFKYGINGKPYLPNGPSFSVSHTLGCSSLLVSNSYSNIGLDIEINREVKNFKIISRNFFTISEKRYCEDNNRIDRFWEVWVKKEAAVKCLGKALLEDALYIDTIEYSKFITDNKINIIYRRLTFDNKDVHLSIAYC